MRTRGPILLEVEGDLNIHTKEGAGAVAGAEVTIVSDLTAVNKEISECADFSSTVTVLTNYAAIAIKVEDCK